MTSNFGQDFEADPESTIGPCSQAPFDGCSEIIRQFVLVGGIGADVLRNLLAIDQYAAVIGSKGKASERFFAAKGGSDDDPSARRIARDREHGVLTFWEFKLPEGTGNFDDGSPTQRLASVARIRSDRLSVEVVE